MPTGTRKQFRSPSFSDGVHVVKIIKAKSKTSETSGNEMLQLMLEDIVSREQHKLNLVFTKKAGWMVEAAFRSLNLLMPEDLEAEWSCEPRHVLGRIAYVKTEELGEDERYGPQFKIKCLTRDQAFKPKPD